MNKLVVYTVYNSPKDYPGQIVVRGFEISADHPDGPQPQTVATVYEDLEKARDALARKGLTCIPRAPMDDPVIVETWL